MRILVIIGFICCFHLSTASLQDKINECVNLRVKLAVASLTKLVLETAQRGKWNDAIRDKTVNSAKIQINRLINEAIICIQKIPSNKINSDIINNIRDSLEGQINKNIDDAISKCIKSSNIYEIVACFEGRIKSGADSSLKLISDAEKKFIPTLSDKIEQCIRPRANEAINKLKQYINETASSGQWNDDIKNKSFARAREIVDEGIDDATKCVEKLKSPKLTQEIIDDVRSLLKVQLDEEFDDAKNGCFNSWNVGEIVNCLEEKVHRGFDESMKLIDDKLIEYDIKT